MRHFGKLWHIVCEALSCCIIPLLCLSFYCGCFPFIAQFNCINFSWFRYAGACLSYILLVSSNIQHDPWSMLYRLSWYMTKLTPWFSMLGIIVVYPRFIVSDNSKQKKFTVGVVIKRKMGFLRLLALATSNFLTFKSFPVHINVFK